MLFGLIKLLKEVSYQLLILLRVIITINGYSEVNWAVDYQAFTDFYLQFKFRIRLQCLQFRLILKCLYKMFGKKLSFRFYIHLLLQLLAIANINLLYPKPVRAVSQEQCAVIFIFLFFYQYNVIPRVVSECAGGVIEDLVENLYWLINHLVFTIIVIKYQF